jgi:hypothetical protein
MRLWPDAAIKRSLDKSYRVYEKLASYASDGKFSREDIEDMLFILRVFEDEAHRILFEREKESRKGRKN